MKRLILSLAAIFSMFFLAESAKAQPISTSCADYTNSQNITFITPEGCTAIVEVCCKMMEISYEVQAVIHKIIITDLENCNGGQAPIQDARFWDAVNDAILYNGCNSQLIILPCDVPYETASLSVIKAACVQVDYDPGDQNHPSSIVYTYDDHCDQEAGYCFVKYAVCRDMVNGGFKKVTVSEEYVPGKCPEFKQPIQELIDLGIGFSSECGNSPCQ